MKIMLSAPLIHVVWMERYGGLNADAYAVGVFFSRDEAQAVGEVKEYERGGKYRPRIVSTYLDLLGYREVDYPGDQPPEGSSDDWDFDIELMKPYRYAALRGLEVQVVWASRHFDAEPRVILETPLQEGLVRRPVGSEDRAIFIGVYSSPEGATAAARAYFPGWHHHIHPYKLA